jgi:hypothetical protein
MGLPRKTLLYGIIFSVIIACSLACGCVCGLSSPGQPGAGNNTGPGNLTVPGSNPGASTPGAGPAVLATPTPGPAPDSRQSAFTINVGGGKDHRPGETLRLYGMDTYSDAVYLFISGMKAPISGGRLENMQKPVADLDAATFTRVNVSEDGSWEYNWAVPSGKPALMFDLYNVIAASEPRDKPHLDEAPAWDLVAVRIIS